MNEPRYINANELKDTLDYYISEAGLTANHNEALTWVKDEFIDDVRTADVAPVIHGHWKNVKRILSSKWGECSNCDRAHEITRYCPYCGAKMDERRGGENSNEY